MLDASKVPKTAMGASKLCALVTVVLALLSLTCVTRSSLPSGSPLAFVYYGSSEHSHRGPGGVIDNEGLNLALYDDGTFLRRREVDGRREVVRGHVTRTAALELTTAILRCVEPLAQETRMKTATVNFHSKEMNLMIRQDQRETGRKFAPVQEIGGTITLAGSAEYNDAGDGRFVASPVTPTPPFWSCLRPLLHIASADETLWVPPAISVVLHSPEVASPLVTVSDWPRALRRPRRPKSIADTTRLGVAVSYKQLTVVNTLLSGRRVALYGYIWHIDAWAPWPGE